MLEVRLVCPSAESAAEGDCVQTGHSRHSMSVSCVTVKTTSLKSVQTTASPVSGSPHELEYARLNGRVHFQALLHCLVLGIYSIMPLQRQREH